ncbi:porin family protein [Bacteroides sp. 51]|uniref:porin family protein n=1 Tax=Bacteroides sp. 51 TaxID=2302938 RepID=UPI0013D74077|nr:porin family protein [Bacteroides sp. 51]NDV83589.1 PorT family protein [Bacteroides sp. 51]
MKKSFILMFFALIATVSYAQQQIPSELIWSVKGGMNISNWSQGGDTKAKIGYKIGGGAEWVFTNLWSVQSGLYLSSRGTKVDSDLIEIKVNEVYLEMPMMGAARFYISDNTNLVLSAGPYIAYGIAGKTKATVRGAASDKENTFGDYGVKRFDLGLGVGVTAEINRLLIGLEGQYGLIKRLDFDGDSPKNMNLSIMVGYKF